MKFSQTAVKKLAAPAGKSDVTIWDDAMPGFGIRFRDGGTGVYVIWFRDRGGKASRVNLGKVAKVNLEDAQTEAKQHFAKIAKGENPAKERLLAASRARTTKTIGDLTPLFIAYQGERGRTKSYIQENERSLFRLDSDGTQNAYFSALHAFVPDEVKRSQIAEELDEIEADHGPIASSRSRAHLSKFWSWAIQKGYVDGGNPVSGTEKIAAKKRDRQHTPKELSLIWTASDDDLDYDVIQKLIMLTGARRNQIGLLKRNEVKRNEMKIVFQGVGRSKNGTRFELPLSQQALALINMVWDRRQDTTGFLFGSGKGGFSGWSKCAAAFKEKLGDTVEDYWLHDYRRTFQSLAQKKPISVPLLITDVCMNHISGEANKGTRKHYNFAEYADEVREAMDKWGSFIEETVKPGRRIDRKAA